MAEHVQGRRHLWHAAAGTASNRLRRAQELQPTLTEQTFFAKLAGGVYRRIVVLTGAGVSTAAGIPDFRSPGGMFDEICSAWGSRFPQLLHSPETLLSRHFERTNRQVYKNEVHPWLQTLKTSAAPTAVHKFCGWLQRQGWLQRVYTQNVDGLHRHADLGLSQDFVVEFHGALRDGSIVMYGDSIPPHVDTYCREDFPKQPSKSGIDLLMVFGTSLQVAPFCALPNMAPRGCTRVLVNMDLEVCMVNDWSRCRMRADPYADLSGLAKSPTLARLGGRDAQLQPLWRDSKGRKKWPQLLVESDCDAFVHRFFDSPDALASDLTLL